MHNLAIDPTDPNRLYAGAGGNGFFRWGPPPRPRPLPPPPGGKTPPPDPLCTAPALWHASADKLAEVSLRREKFWWGEGYVLARVDMSAPGATLSVRFDPPKDIASARIFALRFRGRNADGTRLCVSRIVMEDTSGHTLTYEPDILAGTTWELAELPLRDWQGQDFGRSRARRLEFSFWAPYPTARPLEFAVGRLDFR
ncbi:MAG: hypothetical protein H5T86_12260 [Armatimonadetes bacterium]|nr:hypothetical protein [Armatimonadota bacterium]